MSDKEFEDVVESNDDSRDTAPENSSPDTLRILEALLFASDELLTVTRIKSILPENPDARQIRKMVDKINVQLQKERHPFEIVEIGGGYQFRTVSFYYTWVRQIFKEKSSKKLSLPALECLAIIAYKQPLSKAEIEAIRGVVSDGAMKTLLEKNLVVISGRSEKPGRPLLYATSQEFLKYFGLNKLSDLPRIEEFEAIAREKMEDLSIEELTRAENSAGETGEGEQQSADEKSEINGVDNNQQSAGEEKEMFWKKKNSEIDEKQNVPDPEATAVFEISMDANPDLETKNVAPEKADSYEAVNVNIPEAKAVAADAKEEPVAADVNETAEETFDLEVSFDEEDAVPSEKDEIVKESAAIAASEVEPENENEIFEVAEGKNPIEGTSSADDNSSSEEDEVFLDFLPEEDDSGDKK